MLDEIILKAMQTACESAGGQVPLAQKSGVSQGQISDYICGRRKIKNMTIGTLEKIFPEIELIFFKNTNFDVDFVEAEISKIVHGLSAPEKVKCLKIISANFAEKIIEEKK